MSTTLNIAHVTRMLIQKVVEARAQCEQRGEMEAAACLGEGLKDVMKFTRGVKVNKELTPCGMEECLMEREDCGSCLDYARTICALVRCLWRR